jgi:hypothetical protein
MILATAVMDQDKTENMAEYLKEKFLYYYSDDEVIVSKLSDGYIILVGDRMITVDSNFKITSSKDTTYLISKNNEWTFSVTEDGTAKLKYYTQGLNGTIQIPYAVVDRNDDSENPQAYIVTQIDDDAFSYATELTKVDFSQVNTTLKSIGARAFAFCSNLEIDVPEDLPSSLTTIGDKAFYGCSKLAGSINTIMAKGYTLGKGVFMKCSKLTGDIQEVFNQNFYIDEDGNPVATIIEESQFSGYSGLTGSLVIPNYITKIENNAFYGCTGITSLSFAETSTCTSIGDYAFYEDSGISNSITFPDSIKIIGDYAFYSCSGITGMTLSKNLENIGQCVFKNCSNISGKITIPKTLNILSYGTFWGDSKINEVEFEYFISEKEKLGCKTIGQYAFLSNYNLTKLTFPETLETIGSRAFDWGYGSIEKLYIPDSVTTISSGAFSTQSNMKITHWSTNLTTIGESAFVGCSSITTLPDRTKLITLGESAFYGCISLGKTDLNEKTNIIDYLKGSIITNVGSSCFNSDTYLEGNFEGSISNKNKDTINLGGSLFLGTSVVRNCIIPTGEITVIADNAYDGANKFTDSSEKEVTEIIIPKTVTSIGNYAFSGCSTITKITIPKSVTSIGTGAFMNCINLIEIVFEEGINLKTIPENMCQNDTSLSSFIIPSTVTSIGQYAFQSCSNLVNVNIPSSVTTINNYAYYHAGITNLVLNEGLESIGYGCFDTIKITELVIPDSVTQLSSFVFARCYSLNKVTVGSGIISLPEGFLTEGLALKNVVLRGNVTVLKVGAFKLCSSLTLSGITGLDWSKVTSIGENVFNGCSLLEGTIKVNSNCSIAENALGSNCPLIITK